MLPSITNNVSGTPKELRHPNVSSPEHTAKNNVVAKEKMALRRAAESLRQKVVSTKEYTIISENENNPLDKKAAIFILRKLLNLTQNDLPKTMKEHIKLNAKKG